MVLCGFKQILPYFEFEPVLVVFLKVRRLRIRLKTDLRRSSQVA